MRKIKANAIIFDYGNTLVFDPFTKILKLKIKEIQKAFKKIDYRFKRKEIFASWSKANEEINYPHITHFAQEIPIIEEGLKKLGVKEKDRLRLSKRLLKIYRQGYREIYFNDPRKKEIKKTLATLKRKKKKLAILSNGRKFDVGAAAKLYGISKYLDLILTSEEIGIEKPNPKTFENVLGKLSEYPENVVYIGDDPIKDVKAAKESGMKAILFIPPERYRKSMPWRNYEVEISKKYLPDAEIKKISKILKILC